MSHHFNLVLSRVNMHGFLVKVLDELQGKRRRSFYGIGWCWVLSYSQDPNLIINDNKKGLREKQRMSWNRVFSYLYSDWSTSIMALECLHNYGFLFSIGAWFAFQYVRKSMGNHSGLQSLFIHLSLVIWVFETGWNCEKQPHYTDLWTASLSQIWLVKCFILWCLGVAFAQQAYGLKTKI